MKKLSIIILSSLILIFFCSCKKLIGEGPVVNELRSSINFSGVDLRCSANVFYKQDSVYKVEVSGQQNILDILQTDVVNNLLVIKYVSDRQVRSSEPIMVIVSSPSVGNLRVSGSGEIKTVGAITSAKVKADISGSGQINISGLTAAFFDANISGSGNIFISNGNVPEEKLNISGSGNIDLSNVLSNKATTTTSGSGETHINVSQVLNVTISGSGSVYYKGSPAVNTSISGSGKLKHI